MCFYYKSFNLMSFTLLLSLGSPFLMLAPTLFPLAHELELRVLAQAPDALKVEADRLLQQGIHQFQTRQYDAAIKSWQQARNIYHSIQDRQGEGQSLGNLGKVYGSLQNYAQAMEYHQQSLEIARTIPDYLMEQISLYNLGDIYYFQGNYAQAIDYFQQSLATVRAIPDHRGEGWTLLKLGVVYGSVADYPKAIDYLQQSLSLFQDIDDAGGEQYALGNLGTAYLLWGDNNNAINYTQQFLAIASKNQDLESVGKALHNLGLAYYGRGEYELAIEKYRESLAIARKVLDRQTEGASLAELGKVYHSQGNYTQAIKYEQQGLAISQEVEDLHAQGMALNNIGFALLKAGRLLEAEKQLRDGINIWLRIRGGLGDIDTIKVSMFEEQLRTYKILQQVLIAQNKSDLALEISEQGRAKAFVELLSRQLSSKPIEKDIITPFSNEKIKQIAKAKNATLIQYSIIYDNFKIKDKEQTHESELYIWVIKPTGEVVFRNANLKTLWQKNNTSLTKLVMNSRESIGVRGRGSSIVVEALPGVDQTDRLKQLHKILIDPIADLLPTDPNAHVIFVPQGELFLVPFPALQDENGKYLIEKHTILTAPAIQVLDLTQKQRAKVQQANAKGLVIVGNPTMPTVIEKIGDPPKQLLSLPAAETEAIAIAKLLNTKPLTGEYATKKTVLSELPQAKIIHLATHGLLDDFQSLEIPGAIALAPSDNDNGLLTASEILDLKLNAELVVLSACDTGRGRITGDGVIGLSRSLITAGVPSVVVSLWSVPDAPTAELMTEFYRNWQEKKLDKAQALRQAILTTMKNHSNPKDWAAFTLIGEAN
jgi:CHAT domain-containing protein/Tfp pilus assembly protein PilF